MVKLNFVIKIKAPKEKVWKSLWEGDNYGKWTSVFCDGSHAVSDWNEGSKIQFLNPAGEGMYSMISKKIPGEFMSFKHLGIVKDGTEQPSDNETEQWNGAMENYTLKEEGGYTTVTVDLDTTNDFESYMNETFPKALDALKTLAEN